MLSLTVHAILAVVVVLVTLRANPTIFRRPDSGPMFSPMELALYGVAVASVVGGWTFNIRFVTENTDGWLTNPLWGDGSWAQYMDLMFDNAAASSASIDFIIANVVLLPLIAIADGRRRGINKPWLYFVVTLFASFTAGWAFYAATVERQRRLGARVPVEAAVSS
ncbi:DUF2834 domain-containing protein [Aeromicrobium terrae]|uniref:DUF2834 domain-containing protein n=1 Tax=Aeromicrobium terrae TaxID=2498846 RepID=A0A5C8NLN9_9ACTN|nr:DUF2834 domain-containing protein [Aeromicrobium terrae]TXL62764.1 DUF2834 domain-containing protein [Aeromicrobium terrae]